MSFERSERLELAACDAVALDVLHAALGLALRASAIRTARARLDVPVATEREVRRMKLDDSRRPVAADDERLRVVAEERPRDAAEVTERGGDYPRASRPSAG